MKIKVVYLQKLISICTKFEDEGVFSMLLPWPALFVYGEEAVKFFSTEPSVSNKPDIFYRVLDLIDKNSLFRSNGKRMKKQRKLIGPAFYPKILKDTMVVMNEHAAYLTKELKQLENCTVNDLGKVMEYSSLLLFFETSLGIKPESADKDGRLMKLLHLVSEGLDYIMNRMIHPWLSFDFMLKFSQEGRKHLKRGEEFKLMLEEIIDDMVDTDNSRTASMNLKDVNQLLDHPHHKSFGKILLEEHIADPLFTLEDVKMELTTLIIAESLRLYTVAPIFARYSNKDIQFRKYTIYKGTPIVFFSHMLHRNPELYPNPEIFNPDRFYEGNSAANPWTRIPFAEGVRPCIGKHIIYRGTTVEFFPYALNHNTELYPNPEIFNPDRFLESKSTAKPWSNIPFAEGGRSCLGKNYAMLTMKIFLAHVIRDFRLLPLTQKEDFELTWSMLLRSSEPLSMKFIPR